MSLRGNVLVGQGGGPTAVINASLLGVVEEAHRSADIERIYGARFGLIGLLSDDFVDLGAEDAERLRLVGRTPSAALGTCRRRFAATDGQRALEVLMARNVRFFLYIGGNDSAETAHQLQLLADAHGYEMRCIGVPKTIDNDLAGMDHTPGYGSAARYIAMAARDCACDAACIQTTDPITILEVMGRNAGWLAAASALARTSPDDAPHLIYVPERSVAANDVVRHVAAVVKARGFAVLVVTETVRDENGQAWAKSANGRDEFGHLRLVGAAERIGSLLEERLGLKARFNKPGSLQRSAGESLSEVDWQEAYLVGQSAVRLAVAGGRDSMVTLLRRPGPVYSVTTGITPLAEVAHTERRLPAEFLAEGGQVTAAFLSYARPLIGAELPSYVRLAGMKAPTS